MISKIKNLDKKNLINSTRYNRDMRHTLNYNYLDIKTNSVNNPLNILNIFMIGLICNSIIWREKV